VFGLGLDPPEAASLAKLRVSSPSQVHDYLQLGTFYFFLNSAQAPFDDVRVRQAINYAVNRRTALEAYHQQGQVTCQVLPPNFLGYRPFCPYTIEPTNAGTWTAPDLAKAIHLVDASGTRGQTIEMAEYGPFADVARYVAKVLRSLGYRPKLRVFGDDFFKFFGYVADSRNQVDAGGFWSVGFSTSPVGWFTSQLGCDARSYADPNNSNPGLYCNRGLDARIREATSAQLTQPSSGSVQWAGIDREATQDAAWLALFTQGGVELVSKRVQNYQHHPVYGILLDQLWVR